jgi:manganese/zinc/iron transport system permease protein
MTVLDQLIPALDVPRVFVQPWTLDLASTGWIVAMGFLVTLTCGLVGNYLILRRMALVGDAISHSVLPGLVIAFLVSGTRSSTAMMAGALVAGVVTTVLIELIHRKTRVKQDAAIGVAFTTLFAAGVILVSLFADRVDLDQECVLYGEIGYVFLQPEDVWRMAAVAALTVVWQFVFYKELLVSSFDPGLASSLGINATAVHYGLMGWLSVVVVSAFESVGAILVIAMLILPGAAAQLWSERLPRIQALTAGFAALSTGLGFHLGVWLDCSIAAAMVVAAGGLFVISWLAGARDGLWRRWLRPVSSTGSIPD